MSPQKKQVNKVAACHNLESETNRNCSCSMQRSISVMQAQPEHSVNTLAPAFPSCELGSVSQAYLPIMSCWATAESKATLLVDPGDMLKWVGFWTEHELPWAKSWVNWTNYSSMPLPQLRSGKGQPKQLTVRDWQQSLAPQTLKGLPRFMVEGSKNRSTQYEWNHRGLKDPQSTYGFLIPS